MLVADADAFLAGRDPMDLTDEEVDDYLSLPSASDLVADFVRRQESRIRQSVSFAQRTASSGGHRERIQDDVKMFVWQRDGGECVYCSSNENLEFDHIISLAMGGSNTARNLQLLCEPCNREKGARIA
jgi:5-methylcytosine-specific restriction endonuclease McrA